jgi:hypothetical protein
VYFDGPKAEKRAILTRERLAGKQRLTFDNKSGMTNTCHLQLGDHPGKKMARLQNRA